MSPDASQMPPQPQAPKWLLNGSQNASQMAPKWLFNEINGQTHIQIRQIAQQIDRDVKRYIDRCGQRDQWIDRHIDQIDRCSQIDQWIDRHIDQIHIHEARQINGYIDTLIRTTDRQIVKQIGEKIDSHIQRQTVHYHRRFRRTDGDETTNYLIHSCPSLGSLTPALDNYIL